MTEQAIGQPEQADTKSWGRLLEFPTQRDGELTSTGATTEVVADEQADRSPEPAGDTPRYGRHVPEMLKAANSRAQEIAKVPLGAVAAGWRATAPQRAHLAFVWTGARDLNSRMVGRLLHRDITEAIRQARAAKDYGTVAALEQQKRESANARWERIKLMFEVAGKTAKAAGYTLGVVAALFALVTVGFAVYGAGAQIGELFGAEGGASWASVWTHGYWAAVTSGATGVAEFVSSTWSLATTLFPWLLGAGAIAGITGLHRAGKHSANLPEWAASQAHGDDEVDLLDEGSILGALRNLGISALNNAFKKGWGTPQHPARVWEQGLGRDGKGWRCQIRLPQGVPVSEVTRKREKLAHNLGRHAVEVWVSEPKDKAGVMDLWIAEPGVLTGPVPDWPLLVELDNAVADYFAGVPVGVTIKGHQVTGQLSAANWAMAGMMGSGKSTLAITGLLGALLDPLVEADVFVMAENSDYELMRPRLRTLKTGATDETVEACMANLRELYDELEIRGHALQEHTHAGDTEADKVTRRLAEKDARLRPRIMVIDECQALFLHEKHGAEAERMAVQLMNASRKYGITLMFLTPEPSTDSLPRKLMAVMSNKACFAIGDQQSNDAILGTSSYKRGISAVGLEPATAESTGDVGTAMTSAGFLPKPGLMRCYYVPRSQHKAIIDRAVENRTNAHIAAEAAPEARDVLADALAVTGTEITRASHVVDAMGARWSRYQGWGIKDLVDALATEGVRIPSTDRIYPVDPTKLRQALAARDQ